MWSTSPRTRWLPLVVVLFALPCMGSAEVKERLRLSWLAPGQCGAPDAFENLVSRQSSQVQFVAAQPDRELEVAIWREPQGVVGEISLRTPGEEASPQRVVGTGCAEVLEALTLIAALGLDARAEAVASASELAPAPLAPATKPLPAAVPPAEAPRPMTLAKERPWSVAAGAGPEVMTAAGPAALFAGRANVQLELPHELLPRIGVDVLWGSTGRTMQLWRNARFNLTLGRLVLSAAALEVWRLRLRGGIAFEAGQLASVVGYDHPFRRKVHWLALSERLWADVRLARQWSLQLMFGLLQPLHRTRFVGDGETFHHIPRLGYVGGLELVRRFRFLVPTSVAFRDQARASRPTQW